MIQRFYKKTDKFVKMKVSAPDGRFEGDWIEGGLTPAVAEFEAKRYPPEMSIVIVSATPSPIKEEDNE